MPSGMTGMRPTPSGLTGISLMFSSTTDAIQSKTTYPDTEHFPLKGYIMYS
jgi:hypothetical protein